MAALSARISFSANEWSAKEDSGTAEYCAAPCEYVEGGRLSIAGSPAGGSGRCVSRTDSKVNSPPLINASDPYRVTGIADINHPRVKREECII